MNTAATAIEKIRRSDTRMIPLANECGRSRKVGPAIPRLQARLGFGGGSAALRARSWTWPTPLGGLQ
jgi:hypothetical protein